MSIRAYQSIPSEEILKDRYTEEKHRYSLNHPEGLTLEMKYKGDWMGS